MRSPLALTTSATGHPSSLTDGDTDVTPIVLTGHPRAGKTGPSIPGAMADLDRGGDGVAQH